MLKPVRDYDLEYIYIINSSQPANPGSYPGEHLAVLRQYKDAYMHCDPAKLPLSPRAPVPQILGHSPLSQQGDVFEGVHQSRGEQMSETGMMTRARRLPVNMPNRKRKKQSEVSYVPFM